MASEASPGRLNIPWKGKEKAHEDDFDDLNPTITYRHLLSQNSGVRDPFRVVALCDSDAFYAACEQVRLGLDPSIPLVVLQWESIIAVNYSARKYGISRMDKIKDAKKRCAELVVQHVATYKEGEKEPGYWDKIDSRTHKVSLDYYRRESMKIINMFKEGLPNGEIEKASIDEAFIDFTRPVKEQLIQRYPYLANAPSDAPNGIDTPLPPPPNINWDGLGVVIPISPSEVEKEEEAKSNNRDLTRSDVHEIDSRTTWHDVALSIAAELMDKIRKDVHSTLGYTTSAGIARNKFLAKLSASYKKPNSQSVLRNNAIPAYLRPMGFQKIRFLGGKLGDALAEEYDASTVGDLLTISLEEMQRRFGESALWVYELLRGIDRSEVKEKSVVNKSMLASKNLQQPITTPSEGQHWIRVLAAELALRLNDARKTHPTLWPRTIVLHIHQDYQRGRSKQASFPFVRNVTVDVIASAGDKLWKELVPKDNSVPIKVTNVQLAFTGVEIAESGQRNIEGFFQSPGNLKRPRLDLESDRDAYGKSGNTPVKVALGSLSPDRPPEEVSFTCKLCGQRVSTSVRVDEDDGEDAKAMALATLKGEHEDFHFAQSLAREERTIRIGPVKKKKRKEPEGIVKFLVRK